MGEILIPSDDGEIAPEDEEPVICAACGTEMFDGDQDWCPICRKAYCEDCFEEHDCGTLEAQGET